MISPTSLQSYYLRQLPDERKKIGSGKRFFWNYNEITYLLLKNIKIHFYKWST